MPRFILSSLKGYRLKLLKKDLMAGIIVASLTIPVAMGYASVAGLPPIYGLYASLLPVIGYALFASSPRMIFGIDASASAITGSVVATMGFAASSPEAIATVPVLSLFTALFLFAFAALKLGRFASFISMPVMSGFISGVAVSILIGQIPKIMGVQASGTDFFGNISDMVTQFTQTNIISLFMGAVTVLIILLGKRFVPKIPLALVVLVAGTVVTASLQLDQFNIAIVGSIPQGFPPLALPDLLGSSNLELQVGAGLVVAIVVFADSLLVSNSFAHKDNYTVNDNQELFAFGISNLLASVSGCSPTSSSV